MTLLIGALFGLTSVVLGAYVDHSLALSLSEHSLKSISTAIRYQQLHAIMICVLALSMATQVNSGLLRWLQWSANLFIVGVLLFCFNIYGAIIFNFPALMHIVPTGGMILMLGWLGLVRTAVLLKHPH